MEINDWRDKVVNTISTKYPNEYRLENRYISLVEQIAGLGEEIECYLGNRRKSGQHDTPQQLVAAAMVDLFLLSKSLNTNIEKELTEAVYYFENNSNHTPEYERERKEYFKKFERKECSCNETK